MATDLLEGIENPATGNDLLAGLVPELQQPQVDTKTGAPFGVRFANSLKRTDAGRFNHLVSVFGPENVQIHEDHGLMFRPIPSEKLEKSGLGKYAEKHNGKWMSLDESGLTWRDIGADLIGEVSQAAPEMLSRGGLGAVGAIAAGTSAGVRNAQSAIVPGDDEMTAMDQVKATGIDTALSVGGQIVGNVLLKGYEFIRPHNLVSRFANSAMRRPNATEGARLEDVTGIEFTPGQLTQSRGLLSGEAVARQHPITADDVFQSDIRRLNQGLDALNGAMTRVSPLGATSEYTGAAIKSRYNALVDTMLNVRKKVGDADFAAVAQIAGGERIFPLDRTRAVFDELIAAYDADGLAGDVAEKLAERFKVSIAKLEEGGGAVAAIPMERLLSVWGAAAQGSGRIWTDMDKAVERRIATKVFNALLDDLDAVADSGVDSAAAKAIQVARDNWRALSQPLNDLRDGILTAVTGVGSKTPKSPESIAKAFRDLDPSNIKIAVQYLDDETLGIVKRNFFEEGLDAAMPAASDSLGGQVELSTKRFNTWFRNNDKKLKAVLSKEEYAEFKDINMALSRLSDKVLEGSQTGPWTVTQSFLKEVGKAAISFNLFAAGEAISGVLLPRHIAKAMASKQGRKHLLTMLKSSKNRKAAVGAATYFSALLAEDNITEETE